MDIRISGIGIS